ncbi:MAG: hypothetical protein R3F11_08185 [Verrucomicrobiales bacterium]
MSQPLPPDADPFFSFSINPQPTATSCGPTCLHAVYHFFGLDLTVASLMRAVPTVAGGGTIAVWLGVDALRRGFRARLYTCNLRVLDPTWFPPEPGKPPDRALLRAKIAAATKARRRPKERGELKALAEFLDLGGDLRMEPLSPSLLRRFLRAGLPIIAGLSCTFLYGDPRVLPETGADDDLRGEPEGHFVVVTQDPSGDRKAVTVHDPSPESPFDDPHCYDVGMDRLINAILLGVLTFDANILVLSPAAAPIP